jgi:hypothetical protein
MLGPADTALLCRVARGGMTNGMTEPTKAVEDQMCRVMPNASRQRQRGPRALHGVIEAGRLVDLPESRVVPGDGTAERFDALR